jgi:hypothetical protein
VSPRAAATTIESVGDEVTHVVGTPEQGQAYADRIRVALGRSVEAILEVGRALLAAKAALDHGMWERLFAGHPAAVLRPVPFSIRTAQRLMAIAEHPVLAQATHVSCLPPSWGTLYELTKVSEPVLERALRDGWIHPDMERAEAEALGGRAHVAFNSGEQEWYTPPPILEAARAWLGGIDVDPASHPAAQEVVRATQYFTAEQDGLAQPWPGRVWLNPPYAATVVSRFVDKLVEEYQAGRLMAAVVLVNNCTDTRWGQRLLRAATAVCFPEGRVPFWAPGRASSSPLQEQMIAAVGGDAEAFAAHFASVGVVFPGASEAVA